MKKDYVIRLDNDKLVPLSKLIEYDGLNGSLAWRQRSVGREIRTAQVYLANWNAILSTSKVCWFLHYGEWPDFSIGFKDGNKFNFKIENLIRRSHIRFTKWVEDRNLPNHSGVFFFMDKAMWVVQIFDGGRCVLLQEFPQKDVDAALDYYELHAGRLWQDEWLGLCNKWCLDVGAASLFEYDGITGVLEWSWMGCRVGKWPGKETSWKKRGLAYCVIGKEMYSLGHIAFLMAYGRCPTGDVRHRDGDLFNVCAENLFDGSDVKEA